MNDNDPTAAPLLLALAVALMAFAIVLYRRLKTPPRPPIRYSQDTKAGRLNNARTAIRMTKENLDAADELIASVVSEYWERGE